MEHLGFHSLVNDAQPNPRRPASAQDWEDQRARIRQLYWIEDKPLEEVMSEMELVHGFRATKRQYQTRIAQWRLEKKVKDSESRFIVKKQKARNVSENKDTAFRVRGRTVDPEKIARTMKRKNITSEDLTMSVTSPIPNTPSDVSYYTPAPAHDPTSPMQNSNFMQDFKTASPTESSAWNAFATQDQVIHVRSPGNDLNLASRIPPIMNGWMTYSPYEPPAWDAFATQDQQVFSNSPSFYETYKVQSPAYFAALPADSQSPTLHGNNPNTLGAFRIAYSSAHMSSPGNCEKELARLVQLLRETEESQNVDYMQTMFDVNSLVYDLVTLSAENFDEIVGAIPGPSRSPCHICNALKMIGRSEMAEKVESERLLLKALAVGVSRFEESHSYTFHLRLELFHLYKDWGCRDGDLPELLEEILDLALRTPQEGTNARLFARSVYSVSLQEPGKIELRYGCLGGAFPPWVESLGALLRGQSRLSSHIEKVRIIQKDLWRMISARFGLMVHFLPLCGVILQLGPALADDAIYFWATTFLVASNRRWETIFNSRYILSNAASQASAPGLTTLTALLGRLAVNPYRLNESKNGCMKGRISYTSPIGPLSHQQSEVTDTADRVDLPISLDGLALLLVDTSCREIEKCFNPQNQQHFWWDPDAEHFYNTLKMASQVGNSYVIKFFIRHFKKFDSYNLVTMADLLNLTEDYLFYFDGDDALLNIAAKAGRQNVVSTLIDAGANADGPIGARRTPLQTAADAGHREVVSILIDAGADVNGNAKRLYKPDRENLLPLKLAAKAGHKDVVSILIDAGADVDKISGGHLTALQLAAGAGHEDVVTTLIAAGADINGPAGAHQTPIQLAANAGHYSVVRLLMQRGAGTYF